MYCSRLVSLRAACARFISPAITSRCCSLTSLRRLVSTWDRNVASSRMATGESTNSCPPTVCSVSVSPCGPTLSITTRRVRKSVPNLRYTLPLTPMLQRTVNCVCSSFHQGANRLASIAMPLASAVSRPQSMPPDTMATSRPPKSSFCKAWSMCRAAVMGSFWPWSTEKGGFMSTTVGRGTSL